MYFCPHFPRLDVQKFKRFGIFGEKLWKEVVSHLKSFTNKVCKIATHFFLFFCLTNLYLNNHNH